MCDRAGPTVDTLLPLSSTFGQHHLYLRPLTRPPLDCLLPAYFATWAASRASHLLAMLVPHSIGILAGISNSSLPCLSIVTIASVPNLDYGIAGLNRTVFLLDQNVFLREFALHPLQFNDRLSAAAMLLVDIGVKSLNGAADAEPAFGAVLA